MNFQIQFRYRVFWLIPAFLMITQGGLMAQRKGKKTSPKADKIISIAFYNVENLFDTLNDPSTNDEEFLPDGSYHWTAKNYQVKLENLSRVICELGDENGPEIIGLAEIENRAVLEDLVKMPLLKGGNYGIIHRESSDQRGIDCALLYKKAVFTPTWDEAAYIPFPESPDLETREILLVKGILNGKSELTLVVNHWSSRRGGKEESDWKRLRAAGIVRARVDSLLKLNDQANIILMGDFNDDPADSSISKVLLAGDNLKMENPASLFNPMKAIHAGGRGTLTYRGEWNLFDQLILSSALTDGKSGLKYDEGSANIYQPEFMRVQEEGEYKGAPKRSYIRREFYPDGYSDHFPVFIHLKIAQK